MTPKNKISGWVDKEVSEPPPNLHRCPPELTVAQMLMLQVIQNTRYRANLSTTKRHQMPPYMPVGGRTEESLESTCICLQSQSAPKCPIEGQKNRPPRAKIIVATHNRIQSIHFCPQPQPLHRRYRVTDRLTRTLDGVCMCDHFPCPTQTEPLARRRPPRKNQFLSSHLHFKPKQPRTTTHVAFNHHR